MKKDTVKLIPTRKYHASPRLTHEFKRQLKQRIKWLVVNKEYINFIDDTLKKLPQKDRLPCLYYFKKLTIQVYRAPDEDYYKANEDLYNEKMSEVQDEQKFYDPAKWIDAEINEILALANLKTTDHESTGGENIESVPNYDPELVPEKVVIQILKMSKSKLLRLRAEGMPYQHIGKPIFYNLEEVKKWFKRDAA